MIIPAEGLGLLEFGNGRNNNATGSSFANRLYWSSDTLKPNGGGVPTAYIQLLNRDGTSRFKWYTGGGGMGLGVSIMFYAYLNGDLKCHHWRNNHNYSTWTVLSHGTTTNTDTTAALLIEDEWDASAGKYLAYLRIRSASNVLLSQQP
jgi:hypothetical protein